MKRPFTVRPPRQDDAEAVCQLVIACDIEDFGAPDFDLGELLDMWAGFDLENNVWIVEDEEKTIVGYAFLEEDSEEKLFSYGFVLPSARGKGVGATLLEHIENRAKALSACSGLKKRLQNLIPTLRDDAQSLLDLRGFTPVRYFKRMSIIMELAPAKAQFPAGITVKIFDPNRDEQDVYDAYVESFSDHWDFAAPAYDTWLERTKLQSFKPEWWFVARDEKEEVVGVALCRMREDTLFINQLGVKKSHRGLGLGFSLLHHTFYCSFVAGQPTVSLGVDSANPSGAYRLYEKVGMKPVHEVTLYEKTVVGS